MAFMSVVIHDKLVIWDTICLPEGLAECLDALGPWFLRVFDRLAVVLDVPVTFLIAGLTSVVAAPFSVPFLMVYYPLEWNLVQLLEHFTSVLFGGRSLLPDEYSTVSTCHLPAYVSLFFRVASNS